MIRGFVRTELRNNVLWEERDLTNSSSERIVFTEATVLTDHCLAYMTDVIEGLGFHRENIDRNLEMLDGANMAEAVMMELARKGMGRQKGHEKVRNAAMRSHDEDIDMKQALLEDEEIARYLDSDEIDQLLDPSSYLGTSVERVEEIIQRYS